VLRRVISDAYVAGVLKDATLRQLQILVAAARHGSFSRASRALHLTQPAISMQMKQLEHLAGLPLFDRAGRRTALTPAGEELLRHAQAVLRALQDADDALAALRGVSAGRIAIAVVSTAKYFAPHLLARFARAHPGLELRLLVHNRGEVVRLLADNEVDLAIMGAPPEGLDVEAVAFSRHPLVVVAAPGHPLAARRRVPVSALASEPFLVREPGSGTRAAMERLFRAHRVRPRATTQIESNETIKQAVMAGMGLAFMSRHAIGLELATGRIAIVPVDGLPVVRAWNVVHRRAKRLSPAAVAFRAFVLEGGAELVDRLVGDGAAAGASTEGEAADF
jgi:DNA-binding transcriptional LysR family regulator